MRGTVQPQIASSKVSLPTAYLCNFPIGLSKQKLLHFHKRNCKIKDSINTLSSIEKTLGLTQYPLNLQLPALKKTLTHALVKNTHAITEMQVLRCE